MAAVAAAVAVIAWLLRFNDPGGNYGGLTDDHFFYLVRGWQILFGDLPVRDFVDQGAPLYYYVAAAVQLVFGRGTLSELLFATTILAGCVAGVFWLGARASGSILAGLLAAAFHAQLEPRFYNYPKILVYVVAIPLLWRFAERPTAPARFWLAAVTVVAFLFRHDHGVVVAVATFVTLGLLSGIPWRERARHAALYGMTGLLLVSPYLAFVQTQVGVVSYASQVLAWAERDRQRTPVVWPGLFENPVPVPADRVESGVLSRVVDTVQANLVAWTYYFEIALPIIALALVAVSRDGFRPGWPRARVKIAVVAVLGLLLDAAFLRSPLGARLADPSVPHAILIAWIAAGVPRLWGSRTALLPQVQALRWPIRIGGTAAAALVALTAWSLISQDFHRHMERVRFTEGVRVALGRPGVVMENVRAAWDIEAAVDQPVTHDLVALSFYVNACTNPTDRVFVQGYIPQVLGLARRAFAGGHADLRLGFFVTERDQRLTVERLQRQAVPILLMETDSYEGFRREFPLVTAYFDEHYTEAGSRRFDNDRMGASLFVRKDRQPTGTYAPYGWPCYGSGRVQS